jgi:hypothetical protein
VSGAGYQIKKWGDPVGRYKQCSQLKKHCEGNGTA